MTSFSCIGSLLSWGARINNSSQSPGSSCCGWCWHCRSYWRPALCHCDILCLHPHFLRIRHLLFTSTSFSSFWCPHPQAKRCPVGSWGWSHGLHSPFCLFSSSLIPCIASGFHPRCAPTAECGVVSSVVRLCLLSLAAERALHCNAPHDDALMGAGVVWPWAVGAYCFDPALALSVAPSTAMLTSAVLACHCECCDLVTHFRHLDAFFDQCLTQLVPLYYKDNWQCGDLHPQSPFPDAVRVHQLWHLHRDYSSCLLSMDLISYRLQAFCAYAHVSHEWYCMDFEPFPPFIAFNIDDSFPHCMCWVHYNVMVW